MFYRFFLEVKEIKLLKIEINHSIFSYIVKVIKYKSSTFIILIVILCREQEKTKCCTLRRAKNTPTRSFVSRTV
jgi:hypothetical protein